MKNKSKSKKKEGLNSASESKEKVLRVEEPHELAQLMTEDQMSKFLDLLLKKKQIPLKGDDTQHTSGD
ncbi:MAG: hypothetical protein ACKOQ6_07090 [Bacteroidota bacterium]